MVPFPELTRILLELKSRSLIALLERKRSQISVLEAKFRDESDAQLLSAYRKTCGDASRNPGADWWEVPLYAIVSEAARRTLGLHPFETQILAALAMQRGKVIQMNTGEGKTLVAPFVAIAEIVRGNRCVIVTANRYLSARDAQWIAPLYSFFDISVGSIEGGMSMVDRYFAYDLPVTYVSGDDILFDYLRKQNSLIREHDLPISRNVAIIDEIDNVLIDNGDRNFRLVQSVSSTFSSFAFANHQARFFMRDVHYEASAAAKSLELTRQGRELFSELAAQFAVEPVEASFYLRCALRAHALYRRDHDYIVEQGQIVLIDDVSGFPRPGSVLAFGIQQAIEEKEGLMLSDPNTIINQVTVQGFYSGFAKVCGMSGSALHNAIEFAILYRLEVVPIPPRVPCIRKDGPDVVYRTKAEQVRASARLAKASIAADRPVLVGTQSVEDAEALAEVLRADAVPFALLTARNYFEEAVIISQAGREGRLTIAAKLAGRGVDIQLTDRAKQAGGLHIIGLARARDRRLDDQLIGRAGRQGDPGSSVFIVSLMDDLMSSFGGRATQNMMLRLGMEEDVPIESDLITRRIRVAQRKLVLQSVTSRHLSTLFEECIRDARRALFQRRERLIHAYSLEGDTAELIDRYVEHNLVVKATLEQCVRNAEQIALDLDLRLPGEFYVVESCGAVREELRKLLSAEYARRRVKATQFAVPRERMIFLRSIDLVWSRFVDYMNRETESFVIGPSSTSNLARLAQFLPLFGSERDRLLAKAERLTIEKLFRIHEPALLKPLKDWCGGAEPGDDGLSEFSFGNVNEAPVEMVAAPDAEVPPVLLSQYLLAYRADLATYDHLAKDLSRIDALLSKYQQYLEREKTTVEKTADSIEQFLAGNATVGSKLWKRRFDRDSLNDFHRHMMRQGLIAPAKIESGSLTLVQRTHLLITQLTKPLMLTKLAFLGIFLVLYHWLNIIPIPYRGTSRIASSWHAGWLPELVSRFLNEALLAGSWHHMTIGIVGIVPFVLTDFTLRLFWRSERKVNAFMALPAVLVCCAATALKLTNWRGESLASNILTAAALLVTLIFATTLIQLLIEYVALLEVLDGVSMIVFINLTALLLDWSRGLAQLNIQWYWSLSVVPIVALLWLSDRLSILKVQVVRTGLLGHGTGSLESVKDDLEVATVFDHYHLLGGFFVGAFALQSASRLLPSVSGWASASISIGAFFLATFAMLLLSARQHLSPMNIQDFLDQKDSGLAGGLTSMKALQSKLRLVTFRNALLQALMIAYMSATALFLIDKGARSVIGHPFYFAAVTTIWGCLAVTILSRLRFLLSGYSSSLVVQLPAREPDDDLPWRERLWKRLVRENGGILHVLIFVAGVAQFFDYFWQIAVWIARFIWGYDVNHPRN